MDYYIMTPVTFILRYLEVITEFILVFSMLNRKIEIKKIWLVSTIGFIIIITLKACSPQYLNSLLYPVVLAIILRVMCKERLVVACVASLLSMLIIAIVDCTVCYVASIICGLTDFTQVINNQQIYTTSFLAMLVTDLIIAAIIYYSRSKNLFINIKQAKNINVLITVITTFILLIPNLVILLYYHDMRTLPIGIILINICSIIVLFFVNLYNTKNNIKLAKSEQDLIAQQKYSKTQQDLIDGLRTFKHDYSNTLQTMYGYVQFNKIDKLKELFAQVLDETKAITTLDKLNPNTIKDPGLFGILNGKYQKAKENKLKMEVEIFGNIDGIDMEIFDLTRILGILLDNAIEAAKNSKKKKLTFVLTERKNDITFEITNTFSEKNIDLKKIKEKGISSKGKNRGLGLYKVNEIVNKYTSVQNTTQIEKDTFIQILTISKTEVLTNA